MVDRKKVIKGLQCIIDGNVRCESCGYAIDKHGHHSCQQECAKDAIDLLKEPKQEQKKFTAYEVCMALIDHGQSDERFRFGEIIKYSPAEVEKILKGEM